MMVVCTSMGVGVGMLGERRRNKQQIILVPAMGVHVCLRVVCGRGMAFGCFLGE